MEKLLKLQNIYFTVGTVFIFYGILWSKNILKEKYLQKRWERGDILKMMTLFLLLGFLGTPI